MCHLTLLESISFWGASVDLGSQSTFCGTGLSNVGERMRQASEEWPALGSARVGADGVRA